MGGMGGGQQLTTNTIYFGLQVQGSSAAIPVPIAYGCNTLSPNVIWYNDFQAHASSSSKGASKSSSGTSYTYTAAIILGLCEGPITGIGWVWSGAPIKTPLGVTGLSYTLGTSGQSVWSYLTSAYPAQALAYDFTAYLYSPWFSLGSSASVSTLNIETKGVLYGTGFNGIDADPALVIQDFLTNVQYGVGFPASSISSAALLGGSGTSSYQAYCWANGVALSPILNSKEKASSVIERWLKLTNSTAVWSGALLKFLPFGDSNVAGNGQTWVANVTPVYALTDDDFVDIPGEDPVQITRSDPFSASNQLSVEIKARNDNYNTGPVTVFDQGAIDRLGLRRVGSTVAAHEICDLAIAQTAAQLILQRGLYVRNTYKFKLSIEFCLLEPMDLVTITDSAIGLAGTTVRITDIEEDEEGLLSVTAEEFPAGVATSAAYAVQSTTNGAPDNSIAPGPVNTPIIFEPPGELSGALQLWMLASGSNPANWGGCYVWASFDGASYQQIGQIVAGSAQGVLSAALPSVSSSPSGPSIDTTNTLSVDLTESAGTLLGASVLDAQNGVTLCTVGGELLAYENAVLTATSEYNLTYLVRGLFGTQGSIANHPIGTPFGRVDGGVLKYTYTNVQIGATVYLKFQSFNIFGGALEDISTDTVYTYTLGGTPTPSALTVVSSGLTQPTGALSLTLAATWSADPLAATYQADISADSGVTWTNIYDSTGLSLSLAGLGQANLELRVRGVNAVGVAGPYTLVGVTAPAINYGPATQGLYIGYDQLDESITDQLHLSQFGALDDLSTKAMTDAWNNAQTSAQFGAFQTFASQQFISVANSLGETSTALTEVVAQSAAGTASGMFQITASSTIGDGALAAIELGVLAAGGSGAPTFAGFYIQAMADGTSQVIVNANNFYVLNASTKTVVFGTNIDGSLTLNGVTKVNSVIESSALVLSGSPVMELDFVNGTITVSDNT